MAEQIASDGLKETVDSASSPVHDIATTLNVSASASGNHQTVTPVPTESDEHAGNQSDVPEILYDAETLADVDTKGDDVLDSAHADCIANADASGGSDTDTSRTDAADLSHGAGAGHVRSNSVKKPTTFKSVSVTKNFLAKATPAAPNVRTGEKGMETEMICAHRPKLTVTGTAAGPGPAQLTAKPRLVAKSALGNAGSRSGLLKTNGASGPDASKVWNKNRRKLS
jgi:hypothetical protein